MPLVPKDHYTLLEALDLVADQFPEEDALKELEEPLHRGVLAAWIIDTWGRRVEVPPTVWRSRSPLVDLSVRDGKVMFPLPSRHYSPLQIVSGRIHIDKKGLDTLLAAHCKASVVSTIKMEAECEEWLKNLASPDSAPAKSKNEYFKDARGRWENLSRRGFDRAWSRAVPQEWKRPGAKPVR